jgi:hypothetical protein
MGPPQRTSGHHGRQVPDSTAAYTPEMNLAPSKCTSPHNIVNTSEHARVFAAL